MNPQRCLLIIGLLAVTIASVHAQRVPRIGYVYPAGARQGATVELTFGGQYLVGAVGVHFSGKGITGELVGFERPLNGSETQLLRDRLQTLEQKRKRTAPAPDAAASQQSGDEISAIKDKLAYFGNGRPFNVAIAENVKVRVTLARDATLGEQEVRLATAGGLSNPLVFCVGQLPEFSEIAGRGSLKAEIDATPRGKRSRARLSGEEADAEVPQVTLPAVVNGQILPGEADCFRFGAKRGQRILFAVNARNLIPYLPDAVPGWFQAVLTLRDASGRVLACVDDFRFNPDPVLCYEFPRDGEYEFAIHDSIYRGREDFIYRITAGELPFVASVYPLGAAAGGRPNIELRGWNLPSATTTLDLTNAAPGVMPLVVTRGQSVSNFVPFAVDTEADIPEQEPNDAAAAQSIASPAVVNGRIDRPGDVDVFAVKGEAGKEIVAQIVARRLNSPLDSMLRVRGSDGKELAANDDHEDKGAGLTTHHADSRVAFQIPADGVCFLEVRDAQHGGGPEYAYRLRVGAPRPDFELRVVPSSLNGAEGSTATVTVHALRKDGFSDPILIAMKSGPAGFALGDAIIPSGKDEVKLTVTLPEATAEPVPIELEGHAVVAGQTLVRPAVPAEKVQQAFAYHHLVPSKQLCVSVSGRLVPKNQMRWVDAEPVKIPPGGVVRTQIEALFGDKASELRLELSDPPEGVSVARVVVTPEGAELELAADTDVVTAGVKGNLTIQAFIVRLNAAGEARRIPAGQLPPLPFEITAP